jgi:hypothetical protein
MRCSKRRLTSRRCASCALSQEKQQAPPGGMRRQQLDKIYVDVITLRNATTQRAHTFKIHLPPIAPQHHHRRRARAAGRGAAGAHRCDAVHVVSIENRNRPIASRGERSAQSSFCSGAVFSRLVFNFAIWKSHDEFNNSSTHRSQWSRWRRRRIRLLVSAMLSDPTTDHAVLAALLRLDFSVVQHCPPHDDDDDDDDDDDEDDN